MDHQQTFNALGHVDIYIIDQILKGRFELSHKILDAGCGKGRNLKWFYENNIEVHGIDVDEDFIAFAKAKYLKQSSNFTLGSLDHLPYANNSFDHVLCCAVLHFAHNPSHFKAMFSELIRVLKPNGMLLIRMASNIGLDGNAPEIIYKENGKKGTFYLTREIITALLEDHKLTLIEAIKTTNVQDERAMTTLVLTK